MEFKIESKKLDEVLRRFSNPTSAFDPSLLKSSMNVRDTVVSTTNVLTGETKKSWENVVKEEDSYYRITNTSVTEYDGRSVVGILNDGRGEIRPTRAKKLYIPLSAKGRRKRPGAKVPDDFEYGVDYIFANKARAFPGTRFIDKALDAIKSFALETMGRDFSK